MGKRTNEGDSTVVMKRRGGVVGATFACPRELHGLGGPAGTRTWLGRSLSERVEWAFLESGIAFVGSETPDESLGRFMVREDVVLTRDAVEAFAEFAGDQDLAFEPQGRLANFIADLSFGDEGPWLVYLAPGGAATEARIREAKPVEVDPKERMLSFPLSEEHHGAAAVELPISDRLVMPTWHWLQLVWANLLGLGPFLWRGLMGRNIIEVLFRGLFAVLRAGSLKPQRIGAKLGRRGKRCRIHPSAVVEGCWLEDDVEIGANAVVRGCVLGHGVVIEDLAMVEFSVLDAGARVQRQAMVKFSTLGRGAAVGGLMQLGTLDRHAALKRTGVLMDVSFGQSVSVVVDGDRRPAPLAMAGCCIGERSTVGAGVQVAAGRSVPAGVTIVAGRNSTVVRIPEDIDGLTRISDGTLERI